MVLTPSLKSSFPKVPVFRPYLSDSEREEGREERRGGEAAGWRVDYVATLHADKTVKTSVTMLKLGLTVRFRVFYTNR